MRVLIWISIALITGLLASRKGYNFLLWTVAGSVLGLIVLSLLPFANDPAKPAGEQRRLRKEGNAEPRY